MDPAGAKRVGDILLGEVEEGSLEELLNSLRANFATADDLSHPSNPHHIPMPDLSAMIHRHHRATQAAPSPFISVCGRYLPFLYHFISTLIAAPHNFTAVVVDVEGKFDVTRLVNSNPGSRSGSTVEEKMSLPATPKDLAHVYVYRPGSRAREHVEAVLKGVDEFMVYGDHESKGRAWWGTVVVGGTGGDVDAGWKGWCRVEREAVAGLAVGISVEEALRERGRRHEAVEQAGWSVASGWGAYVWKGK